MDPRILKPMDGGAGALEAGATERKHNKMKGALRLGGHIGSGDEIRHRIKGELCSHPPPQTRQAEGTRRNEFSQEHPLGRGEVPSLRGLGILCLKVKTKTIYLKEGLLTAFIIVPERPQKQLGDNLRADS